MPFMQSLINGIRSFMGGKLPTGDETRDRARVLCRYPVNCSTGPTDVPFRAQVLDISRSGMRLEGVGELAKGSKLYIAYANYPGGEQMGNNPEPVEVEVMWTRKRPHDGQRLAGVRYSDAQQVTRSWVQHVLEEVGQSTDNTGLQRRKHIRLVTALRADLRDQVTGQTLASGKLANLSVGGVLVQTEQPVRDEQDVLVLISPYNNFPILSLPGRVRNTRFDNDEGVTFVSVQFINVSTSQTKTLKRYMANLLQGRSIG